MTFLASTSFLAPSLLIGLLALPALWWLLRMTPPPPRRELFPAIRLLAGLPRDEETPARTPWWLLALRLIVATLVILGLAHPVSAPGSMLGNRDGTVVLVVDDGWASAPGWTDRQTAMDNLLVEAERQGRSVRLLKTAPSGDGAVSAISELMSARDLRPVVRAMVPKSWQTDRVGAIAAFDQMKDKGATEIFWIADGLEQSNPAPAMSAADFATALQKKGPVSVLRGPQQDLPQLLNIDRGQASQANLSSPAKAGSLSFVALRTKNPGPAEIMLIARDLEGRILDRQKGQFANGVDSATFTLDIPNDIRNRIGRVEIAGQQTAGSVFLLDERWRRRIVGLVSGQNIDADQPLLSSHFYLEKALEPVADTRIGDITSLLKTPASVLVLADVGRIVGRNRADLTRWIDDGGVLVRFAGPRLAESGDDFVPVRLRTGNRVLAGAMTWSTPLPLMAFEETSPFYGLVIPKDVLIRQQVLAEPSATLSDRTWARLKDGTPIVTAQKRGEGWLVLIHATANADWSDLPFSGLFVSMLERLINLAHGSGPTSGGTKPLKALQHLDAFGHLQDPQGTANTLGPKDIVGAGRPPGYYGSPAARRALNLGPAMGQPRAFGPLPRSISEDPLAQQPELDFKPALLMAALILLIVDLFISLLMRGLVPGVGSRFLRVGRTAGLVLLIVGSIGMTARQGQAQTTRDAFAMAASLETRLAYFVTGDRAIDKMSEAGLTALTDVVRRRTSVEGGAPLGVDPEIDELVFFPLIYWPLTADMKPLSEQALARVNAYMKTGGTILFDTRDQPFAGIGSALGNSAGASTPERTRLTQMLRRLDVPPLVPIPSRHILTRAFYLMQAWPGRWAGGQVWVEKHNGGINDGVSGLVIGGHDWAAAWATDVQGAPLAAVVPGGQRQREMAYRFGVNLMMYALTGNYKADQVHVPALLERLGQ